MSDLTPEQIASLADKMLKGTIDAEERILFEQWYNAHPEQVEWQDATIHSAEQLQSRMLRNIKGEKNTYTNKWYWAAAAVILLLITGSIYHYSSTGKQERSLAQKQSGGKNRLVPGTSRATLTLANGDVVVLDDEHNGTVAKQGNVQIIKLNNGQLSYQHAGSNNGQESVAFNTLSTPRGGQYQLTLPDGTLVWMNAASTLVFPTVFNGKDRTVQLKGEAYFEVAGNEHQPFIVNTGHTSVKVLGTSFNVMAYADEEITRTTLLQGKVKVAGNNEEVLLKPGQQAKMMHSGKTAVAEVNIEEVVAWKNGIFSFNDVTIEEVMHQLARWYDAEVIYPDGVPKGLFRGEIDRKADISTVLKILEVSGVKFTVEGRKIFVRQ